MTPKTPTLDPASITAEARQRAAEVTARVAGELPSLQAERQRLALAVSRGQGDVTTLEALEDRIAGLERERDRAEAALHGAEALAAQTEAEAVAAQRTADLARLDALQATVNARFREVDAAVDVLAPAVAAAVAAYREMYGLASNLDVARERGIVWNVRARLVRVLQTRLPDLSQELGHIRPDYRIERLAATREEVQS